MEHPHFAEYSNSRKNPNPLVVAHNMRNPARSVVRSPVRSPIRPWTARRIFKSLTDDGTLLTAIRQALYTTSTGVDNVSGYGDPVGLWADQSGSGNDASQATSANRPAFAVYPRGGVRNLLDGSDALETQSVTVTAVAHTLSFRGTGTVTLSGVSTAGPLVGTGADDIVTLTFTPTAGSLTLTVSGTVEEAQLERGSARSHYQSRVDQYEITEAGVPGVECLAFNGSNQYLTMGVTEMGDTSLFCDENQTFCVAVAFKLRGNGTLIGKASADSLIRTFQLYYDVSANRLRLYARGVQSTLHPAALAENVWHVAIVNWDGVEATAMVDSLTPTTLNVGTAAEETSENILIGARTASSPAHFFNGEISDISIIDKGKSLAERQQLMRYLASKVGVSL